MQEGAYTGRHMEVRHAISLASQRFTLRLRRAAEPPRNGRLAVRGPLTPPMSVRDLLWSSVLTKQLRIIDVQTKMLQKNDEIVKRLSIRNQQLAREVDGLRTRRYGNDDFQSRHSSSESSESECQPIRCRRSRPKSRFRPIHNIIRTYRVRRQLNLNSFSRVKPLPKQNNIFKSRKLNPPIRKTRASALPEDLVPTRDFIPRRNRQGKNKVETFQQATIKHEKVERKSMEETENVSGQPRIEFHLEENYVSTLDPELLIPPSIFKQVGLEEVGSDILSGNIEVPSWRTKKVDPSRLACWTEDLDDDIYLRRHFKAEEAEKRRKRWDAQKTREEEYVEQLKERLAQRAESRKRSCKAGTRKPAKDGWDDLAWIEPFHPNPKEALFLQVEDQVPINVFGTLLPAFPPEKFTLPWDPEETYSRTDRRGNNF